jgi:acetyl-CoA acyltransferase
MAFPLDAAIVSLVRTPVGRALKGTLRSTRPDDLGAAVVLEAIARVKGLKTEDVEDVVLGCAMPEAEQGLNLARNIVLLSGLPHTVCGETINRFCSSGLQAIAHAALQVQTGLADVVVAGGVESMSMVPMGGNKVSLNPKLVDRFPESYIAMGHTAERVSERFNVSRADQDAFAVRSHERALAAISAGRFKDETFTVKARVFEGGKASEIDFSIDECPRPGTTAEVLGKLKPAFKAGGSVTAGNSSPTNDGAAAAVVVSNQKLAELGVSPLARLRGYAVAGVDPDIMGIGPVPAIRKLLKQTGLSLSDIDLFEINEAFAAQAVYCARELGVPDEKLNVNGGAIALGHPLGATGAKLAATLVYELKRRGGRLGIVSMCIGGGMGAAGLFEV